MQTSLEKLTLELLRRCPNRCLHCSTGASPVATDSIPLSQVKHLIDEALQLGLRKVILSGGEPLIYQDLVPLLEYLHEHDLQTVIYTSGSIFDANGDPAPVPLTFLNSLKARSVHRFNLSLHSSSPSVHDQFMETPGSWDRAWAFLQHAHKIGCDVHVHTVIIRQNCNDLLRLASLLEKGGVRTLRLLRLVPQGRAKLHLQDLAATESDYEVVREQLGEIARQKFSGLRVRLGPHIAAIAQETGYECSLDKGKLLVQPDGSVSVCAALKGARRELGAPCVHTARLVDIVESDWRTSISKLKWLGSGHDCPAQNLYGKTGTIQGEAEHACARSKGAD